MAWIPTLYVAEGLPYVAVNTLSVIMYKNLGMSNTDIAFYTGWLYLPWVIKPFWSPFVDIIKTKRWWTVTTQFIIGAAFAAIALTLPLDSYVAMSLAVFWLIGFASATHDIAADGYYMLALDSSDQSLYVGIRSAFYRLATIFRQCPEGLGGNLPHPVCIVLRGSRVPLEDTATASRRQTLGKHTAECRQGQM